MKQGPLRSRFLLPFMLMAVVSVVLPRGLQAQAAPKVGDSVQVNTGFGWIDGKITKVNGNSYYVHTAAGDVWKSYPTELRKSGAPNAEDRANGRYQLHDKVKVHVDGQWVDGEIVTTMGQDYQVKLPGNRTAWASPQDLRYEGTAAAPQAAKGGVPPKPGMTSCAGKLEGRYSNSGGFGNFTVQFHAGEATMTDPSGQGEKLECWISGKKVILRKAGAPQEDMPININDDGTLDTPLGEIKRKGS
jgi:hypothetical protein